MKKFIFLLCFLLLANFFPFPVTLSAKANSNFIYAKISFNNVYFYSLPQDREENKLFMLPHTYFVKLLSSEGSDFYYAQYDEIFGYVKKTSVTAMKGTPQNPFATSTFRIFSLNGIGFYKQPSMEGEKMADLEYLSEELTYYGTLQGQEVIPEKSNQWYFAKHKSSSSFGYVYSVFCDKLSKIKENTETFETISSPLFTEDTADNQLSPVSMTFIIIGVSLPCLIVLYLLVKPTMFSEKITKSHHKLKTKRKHDYFEFDESDLN